MFAVWGCAFFFLDGDWPAPQGPQRRRKKNDMDTRRMRALAVCLNEGLRCVFESNTSFFSLFFLPFFF